jgi:flagellar biosynthesis/type III secretory pathway protein FliH
MKRYTLPAILLAAGLIGTAPACAQTYGYGGYRDYRTDVQRRAYERGFHEGTEDGRSDARKGRTADYRRHDEFRDADEGYSRSYGDKEYYRDVFRRGYAAGYSEAYRANSRYYGGYGESYPSASTYPGVYPVNPGAPAAGYYSPAAQNGYRDGLKAGRDDARDGDRYDPVRSRRYRDGDNDYDRRYGDRDAYKREYREAFQQGYRDGYGAVRR